MRKCIRRDMRREKKLWKESASILSITIASVPTRLLGMKSHMQSILAKKRRWVEWRLRRWAPEWEIFRTGLVRKNGVKNQQKTGECKLKSLSFLS